MPLNYQPVPMKFGVTQDESTHPFVLPNPLLQSLVNGRCVKGGSIQKRPGWDRKVVINADSQIVQVNDALLAIEPSVTSGQPPRKLSVINRLGTVSPRADSVSGAAGTRSLSEVDVLGRENIWRDNSNEGGGGSTPYSSRADHALDTTSNIEVVAWTGRRNNLFCTMAVAIDATTRQPVSAVRVVSSPTTFSCYTPRVVALNGQIIVVYQRPGANELRAVPYDTTTRTWGTDTAVAANLNANPFWDAYASGGVWYLAYRSTTPNLTLLKLSGVTVVTTITIAEDPGGAIGVHADSASGFVWIGWYVIATGLRVAARATAAIGTVILAPTTIEGVTDLTTQMAFTMLSATQVIATWTTRGFGTIASANYGRMQTSYRTVTTAGVLGTQCSRASFELISRPWVATNGTVYANVLYDAANDESPTVPEGRRSSGFQTAFTMRLAHGTAAPAGADNFSWQPVASWAIGSAGMSRRYNSLSNVTAAVTATSGPTSTGATEYRFMLCTETPLGVSKVGTSIIGASGVDLCRLNISVANIIAQFAAPVGRNVAFSGGIPYVFDGETLTEYGFLVPPENGRGVPSAAGFSALTAGSIAVDVVAEYMLATGDIIRSAPAVVYNAANTSSIIVAADDKLTVGVPSIGLTNKYSDVTNQSDASAATLKLYRTEANGTIYRADATIGVQWGAVTNLALQRLTNQSPVAQSSDLDILSHQLLYTNGDILPNYPLPSLSHLINHANRLMGISAEDRRVLVFTHTYEPGELPGWHPDLQIQLEEEAVALASMDEKLFVLCKHGVYIMGGDGPDRKGLNSNFSGPDRLNGPHGCVSATSVVSIPLGVLWQAPTGIMMLDRKYGITRIGGPVEDTLAAYPVCIASGTWPEREWAYWSLASSDFTGFRTICFDWRNNVWSVDVASYVPEIGPNVVTGQRSFAVYQDEFYSTFATVAALYQHTGHDDLGYSLGSIPGAWIELYMKTAWINLGQVLLFQRARWLSVLADRQSVHGLIVVLTQDHGISSETFTWTNAQITGATYERLAHHIANQRCSSVQLEIADAQDTAVSPFGAGAVFVGVSWELGFKAGRPKLPGPALK